MFSITMVPGQIRFMSSPLVTSLPADSARSSIISKGTPTNQYRRSMNPEVRGVRDQSRMRPMRRSVGCLQSTRKRTASVILPSAQIICA